MNNFKKYLIIFSIIMIFFVMVGLVSANENSSDVSIMENSDIIVTNSTDQIQNNILNTNEEDIQSADNESCSLQDSENKPANVKFLTKSEEYTSGNLVYKLKVYDIFTSNGINYLEPRYNSIIKLKVFTGTAYKCYSGSVGNDGTVSVKLPSMALGNHKVEAYLDNVKQASSTLKITKSKTKVYAIATTLKFKKDTYFKIKVLDSHSNPVSNVNLKVSVYTGKKFKTYTVKTNSKGMGKLKTSKLSLGTHKVIIKTSNKHYSISKTSKIIIKSKVVKKAKQLYSSAPVSTLKYKDNSYYKFKVIDAYKDMVKNIYIKVKVFTGKKFKTYSVKTDSQGVAKFNTKKLSIGTHKIVISPNDTKNYKLNKSSKIIIKKTISSSKIAPTKLLSLHYYPKGYSYFAKLKWSSKTGTEYQVLRKTADEFKVISTIKSNSKNAVFYDEIGENDTFTYSVREIIKIDEKNKMIGPYDAEGLKLINKVNVDVDFQNLMANITWSKMENATKYIIFRKIGEDGEFKSIGSVGADVLSYVDYYYKSVKQLRTIIDSKTFVDPSFNSLHYTVRACIANNDKISYGLYLKEGDFHLEAPSIVLLVNNTIKWGSVPNAEGYLILKRNDGDDDWQMIGQVPQKGSTTISFEIGCTDYNASYSVKAYANKNGKIVYSDFDKGFSLKNYSKNNNEYRILFFGDSITYGSPYKSQSTRHIFSIPHRVAQLLGCVYYNPSIPGSTYHDLGQKNGVNIENTKYYRYRICREVVDAISMGQYPGNWESLDTAQNSEGKTNTTIEDYNIVVLAAGTNDYLDNSELGSQDSNDTSTFNGAFNHIMDKIENASKNRVERGESPIKVVFVDLYYSDRTYTIKELHNRDITPNEIGLTLTDYQNELNKQFAKWENTSEYLSFHKFQTRDYDIVNQHNCPYTSSDNLHFTKYVYGQYGNAFANFLVENVF